MPLANAANFLAASGLAFTGLQYNRDGFADAVAMRQNQIYQEKNYHIAWVAAVREEVRDFMTIFVGRMNNAMIVNTLLAGIATGFICEGEIASKAPDFISHVYYMILIASILFFAMAMGFACQGTSVAYAEAGAFLQRVVPDQQDAYDFDYMKQLRQYEESPEAFRVPFKPDKSGHHHIVKSKEPVDVGGVHLERLAKLGNSTCSKEEFKQRKDRSERFSTAKRPSYYEILGKYNHLWKPCAAAAYECTQHGSLSLAHGLAYFLLGHSFDQSNWASIFLFVFVMLASVFLADGLLLHKQSSQHKESKESSLALDCSSRRTLQSIFLLFLIAGGPFVVLFGALANPVPAVPLAFAAYAVFHLVIGVSGTHVASDSEPVLRQPRLPTDSSDLEDGKTARRCPEVLLYDLLQESRKRSQRMQKLAKQTIAFGHGISSLAWLSLAICMLASQEQHGSEYPLAEIENIDVQWPSDMFEPRALSCAESGRQVWMANDYGIFSLSKGAAGGDLRPWPCPLTEVQDMALACSSGSCSQLLLSKNGELVTCNNASSSRTIHQPPKGSSLIALSNATLTDLYFLHGAKLVDERSRVEVKSIAPQERLVSFDILMPSAFLFFSSDSRDFVEVSALQHATSPAQRWRLPDGSTWRTACALDSSTALAILQDGTTSHRLARIKLPATGS